MRRGFLSTTLIVLAAAGTWLALDTGEAPEELVVPAAAGMSPSGSGAVSQASAAMRTAAPDSAGEGFSGRHEVLAEDVERTPREGVVELPTLRVGVVQRGSGEPVEDAAVYSRSAVPHAPEPPSLFGGARPARTTMFSALAHTREDGSTRVSIREDGPSKIWVVARGFAPTPPVEVEPGRTEPLLFEVGGGRTATVSVFHGDGRPAEDHRVWYEEVLDESNPRYGAWTVSGMKATDAHGRVRFDDLAPVRYRIVSERKLPGRERSDVLEVDIGENEDTHLTIRFPPIGDLTVQIDGEVGPLRWASIVVEPLAGVRGRAREQRTDPDGVAAFSSLDEGRYQVTIDHEDRKMTRTEEVELPGGRSEVLRVVWTIADLRGVVRPSPELPLEGLEVTLTSARDGKHLARAAIGSGGHFALDGIDADRDFLVDLRARGHVRRTFPLRVPPGSHEVEWELEPGAELEVSVVSEGTLTPRSRAGFFARTQQVDERGDVVVIDWELGKGDLADRLSELRPGACRITLMEMDRGPVGVLIAEAEEALVAVSDSVEVQLEVGNRAEVTLIAPDAGFPPR